MIPYGRQSISVADIDAVVEVLKSDFLTQGPVVPAFEQAVAAHCGAEYGIAMNSATSALPKAITTWNAQPGIRSPQPSRTAPMSAVTTAIAQNPVTSACGECGKAIDSTVTTEPIRKNALPTRAMVTRDSPREASGRAISGLSALCLRVLRRYGVPAVGTCAEISSVRG